MEVIPFLEYLHEHRASRELAEGLAQVFALKSHGELVPAELAVCAPRRVAS